MKAKLCRCNMCNSILIDKNPQSDAKNHLLKGNELKMEEKVVDNQRIWVCPICKTDDYLIDL